MGATFYGDEDGRDFQLARQIGELRDQRDLAKAHALVPSVVEDDLTWLLDTDHGGSVRAGVAKREKEDLASLSEQVTDQRLVLGALRNQALRRESKLAQMQEQLKQLQSEAAETPRDRKDANANRDRHDATRVRVADMEMLAEQQVDYTQTLQARRSSGWDPRGIAAYHAQSRLRAKPRRRSGRVRALTPGVRTVLRHLHTFCPLGVLSSDR